MEGCRMCYFPHEQPNVHLKPTTAVLQYILSTSSHLLVSFDARAASLGSFAAKQFIYRDPTSRQRNIRSKQEGVDVLKRCLTFDLVTFTIVLHR